MNWTDLGTVAFFVVISVALFFFVLLSIELVRKRFKVTEVELPFFGLFKVTTERVEPKEDKKSKTRIPRTIQEAKAEDGGYVKDVRQSTQPGSASSQRASAKGKDSRVEGVDQKIG
jgi:hypothetical protein